MGDPMKPGRGGYLKGPLLRPKLMSFIIVFCTDSLKTVVDFQLGEIFEKKGPLKPTGASKSM